MSAPLMVRGLRGATTVDVDSPAQVTERSQELMLRLMERNELVEDDIVSALFTATAADWRSKAAPVAATPTTPFGAPKAPAGG